MTLSSPPPFFSAEKTSTSAKKTSKPFIPLYIEKCLREKRVLVCVGSGGVGKTTTAAALALLASTFGRRTLVITIDPARRLANSLGLEGLTHTPKTLSRNLLLQNGIQALADVDAMMLDLQSAWDDLLQRTSPTPQMQEKLLSNRFYKHLTQDLPGAQEFVACEALQILLDKNIYDLILLDTPPTSNALDFLEAPNRILDFLDNEAMRSFYDKIATQNGAKNSTASRLGFKIFDGATTVVQSAIAKFTGPELLDDLGDFLGLIHDFISPLKERTRAFQEMLKSDQARFIVVTAPEAGPLNEALFFADELQKRQFPLAGVLVNRVMPPVLTDEKKQIHLEPEQIEQSLKTAFNDEHSLFAELSYSLQTAALEQQNLAQRDKKAIHRLQQELPQGTPLLAMSRQQGDVADIHRLQKLFSDLLGQGLLQNWLHFTNESR